MQEIGARYGQGYNTGSFPRQLSSVIERIMRLSLPGPKLAAKSPRAMSIRGAAEYTVGNAASSGYHAAA